MTTPLLDREELDNIFSAANYLNVSTRTVRRYIDRGKLPAYQLPGGGIRFKRSDVEALLRPIPTARSSR